MCPMLQTSKAIFCMLYVASGAALQITQGLQGATAAGDSTTMHPRVLEGIASHDYYLDLMRSKAELETFNARYEAAETEQEIRELIGRKGVNTRDILRKINTLFEQHTRLLDEVRAFEKF
uniref:Uncharacterized protein n=1 Tax=Zooxanthella nutricula TaxID=1333877 RepID=A0A7S2VME7_9DINO